MDKMDSLDTAMSFPERLKKAIGGKSARAFALECGISPTGLHQYLSGKSEPTRPALVAIANTSGVDLQWLITGEGEMFAAGNNEPGVGEEKEGTCHKELLLTVLEAFEAAQKMHWFNPGLMTSRSQTALIYTLYVLFSDNKLKHLANKEFIVSQAGFIYLMITNPGNLFDSQESMHMRLNQVGVSDELNLFGKSVEILSQFMVLPDSHKKANTSGEG